MPVDSRERGSVVIGWLVKLCIAITVVGVGGFDAISVGVAHLNGTDDANSAASAAASAWQQSHDVQLAEQAADEALGTDEAILPHSFTIDPDGSVHLTLQRTATTMLLYRIGPLKKYTTVLIKGDAPAPTV